MRRTPSRGPLLRLNPPCSLPRSPTLPLSRPRSPLSSRPQFPRRHARDLLSGRPESLLLVDSAPAQLKTLDSVSVRNIVATLPYSSTARNDGPSRSRSTYHYAHGLPHRHARILLSGHPVHFSRHDPEFSEFFAATRLDTPGGRWFNPARTNQARNPLCRVTC